MNIKVNPLLLPTVMNISIVPEPDKNESEHLIRRTKESSANFVSEIDKTQICIFQRIIIQDIIDKYTYSYTLQIEDLQHLIRRAKESSTNFVYNL